MTSQKGIICSLLPTLRALWDIKKIKILPIAGLILFTISDLGMAQSESTMDEIYNALKLEDLQSENPSYVAGEQVDATYELVNRSDSTLVIALNFDFSRPFHLVGIRQHWIERLGPDNNIAAIPDNIGRDGARYAAGGSIIAADSLWAPSESRTFPWGFGYDTSNFPAGTYRFYVEYKKLHSDGGDVIQTVNIDFEIEGPKTIYVPSEQPTIQAGINAANPKDTVLVAPGLYFETLVLKEGVNLIGSGGFTDTIIDGQGRGNENGSVVVGAQNGLIRGFTIRNANLEPRNNLGAAIVAGSSTSSFIIRENWITNCRIGISTFPVGSPTIEKNVIVDNPGLAGIGSSGSGTPIIRNNTILNNYRGIQIGSNSIPDIVNNIVAGNSFGIINFGGNVISIRYNDVFGNNVNYDQLPDQTGIQGNISEDPLFVDPDMENYHLQGSSPCIDAGDPDSAHDPDSTVADIGAFYSDPSEPTTNCFPDLPNPNLIVTGTEEYTGSDGQMYTRYLMSVTNRSNFPDELFEAAPDLPPCGLNQNASRTWVDIYEQDGRRIYGFCALSSPENLDGIWFARLSGVPPPDSVYITLTDRRCNIIYTSNLASTVRLELLRPPTNLTVRAAENSVVLSWAGEAVEESEPNDTFEMADILNIGQVATGIINPVQDIDFWIFQGTMGQNVTIDVDAQVNGSAMDAVIGLFINEDLNGDGSPDVIVVNDDFGGSFDSRIEINLPKTQTYFISIADFSSAGGPDYFYDMNLTSTSGMLARLSAASYSPLSRAMHKLRNAKISRLKSQQESKLSIKLFELPELKSMATNKVALTSSETADLLGYNIYRSTSSPVRVANENRIGGVSANTSSFTDMDVQIGTIYYYVVTAVYDGGESEPSNEVSAEPQKKLWEQTGLTNKSVLPLVVNSNNQLFAGIYGDASLGFPGEGMIRSVDNGDTWTQINNGLLDLNIFSLAVNSMDHLYAGTEANGVLRSTDNGDSWNTVNTGLPNDNGLFREIRSLVINMSNHIFAATSAGIFRSRDNGNNWVHIGLTMFPGRIAVNSSGHLFVGTELDGIFRSTDNGDNWQQSNTGLPDRTVLAIGIDPSDNIFIMTNAGVFRSNNSGDSWTDVTNGIMHFIFSFTFNSSGHIFAGTIDFSGEGGGVYRSTDDGESWTRINAALTSLNILSLAVNSQDQIFAGTLERGLFRSVQTITSVEEITSTIPISFALEQNYPNPFNPETTIRYVLPEASRVKLAIYNLLGQRIVTLVDQEQQSGIYSVQWDGKNEAGQNVASGLYLYQLKAGAFSQIKKMSLIR